VPKPPALPDSDARRGLSPTDSVVIDNISRLYREHGTIAGNKSQLARDAEIDPGFISKLLQRKNSVSLTYLHRIAKALGLEPWMLLVPGDWPYPTRPCFNRWGTRRSSFTRPSARRWQSQKGPRNFFVLRLA
jgi:transcriptional regulator with XRE-family HTH domain